MIAPVTDDAELIGASTDRDITVRATANGFDPKRAHVRWTMTIGHCGSFEVMLKTMDVCRNSYITAGGVSVTYHKSRSQREAAFLEVAMRLYAQLEDWYDQHPTASFGEFEIEARRVRQELMGHGLALVINGRDTGARVEPPKCPQCYQSMQFVGYRAEARLGSETELQPACYVCHSCEKQTLFHPQLQAATAVGSSA